jgi:hypothetical protein
MDPDGLSADSCEEQDGDDQDRLSKHEDILAHGTSPLSLISTRGPFAQDSVHVHAVASGSWWEV